MYFSQALYQARDEHLFNALGKIYNAGTGVPCIAEVRAVNDQYIMIRMNDDNQQTSDFIRQTIKQRKIERFMDKLNDAMSLPRNAYKDERGEKTIICEPKDLIAALYVLAEDLGLELTQQQEMHDEIRSANHLSTHITPTSRQLIRVPMQ